MNPEIWRYVFDTLEEPVFLHDAQFRVLLANRAYCRAAGVTEAQALGKPYWEVFPPGSGPLPGCKDAIIGKGHDGSQEEVSVGAKLFLSRGYTVRDEQDKPLYALHLLSDITAQRQAEAALADSEERFRRATETARDAVITLDGESGVVITWNPAAEAMFGYGKEAAVGRVLHDFLPPPRFRAAAAKAMAHFASTGAGAAIDQTLELVARHKNGTEFPIELSLSATQIHNKWLVTGIARDISKRKQAEEALYEAQQGYRALIENSPDIIARYDRDCRRTFVNPMYLKVAGIPEPELLAAAPLQRSPLPAASAEVLQNLLRRVLDSGIAEALDVVWPKADKIDYWYNIYAFPEFDLQGRVVSVMTVSRDITARKQAEELLRQREVELNESQRVAHIGSWDWTVLNDTIWWSDEYYRIFGRDPKQPTPNYADHLNAYTAESAQRLDLVVKRAMETGEPYEVDLELAQPTPATQWIVARGEAKRDASGKISGLRGTAQNITERKQNELALARANRALRTLSACNEALVRAGNESELLDAICRLVVETGGYRMAWVGFPEQDAAKTVRPVAQYGHDEGYLAAANISWADSERGRGPSGAAIRTGTVQVNQNFLTDPVLAPWRAAAQTRGYQSIIALPLQSAAGILGMLTIYASVPDAFNEAEVALLQELAGDLAFGIETLRTHVERDRVVYEQLHHVEILRQGLEDSVKAIANTVEMRDPYTAGHQRRVGQLAAAIARELGLPEDTMRGIELAASIHDLGKISVPAEILAKPSTLTAIEFMLLKNHAQAGFDIIKDIKFPWPIATIVLQHHERQDGSGYPQRLKGEQILLESRILAVADVVEAMASHRPYRAALGIDSALQEIERGRGTAYDAAVVDACLRLFAEKRFAFSS